MRISAHHELYRHQLRGRAAQELGRAVRALSEDILDRSGRVVGVPGATILDAAARRSILADLARSANNNFTAVDSENSFAARTSPPATSAVCKIGTGASRLGNRYRRVDFTAMSRGTSRLHHFSKPPTAS